MKPIQAYPSMRAAVRELGTEGFVSAVLGSQRGATSLVACAGKRETHAARAGRALVVLAAERDHRASRP